MNVHKLVIASLTLAAATVQADEGGGGLMSTDELNASIATQSVWLGDVVSPTPTSNMRLEFKPNGFVYAATAGGFTDSGPWKIKNGLLCLTLRKWSYSELCEKVTLNADGSRNFGEIFKGKK